MSSCMAERMYALSRSPSSSGSAGAELRVPVLLLLLLLLVLEAAPPSPAMRFERASRIAATSASRAGLSSRVALLADPVGVAIADVERGGVRLTNQRAAPPATA